MKKIKIFRLYTLLGIVLSFISTGLMLYSYDRNDDIGLIYAVIGQYTALTVSYFYSKWEIKVAQNIKEKKEMHDIFLVIVIFNVIPFIGIVISIVITIGGIVQYIKYIIDKNGIDYNP